MADRTQPHPFKRGVQRETKNAKAAVLITEKVTINRSVLKNSLSNTLWYWFKVDAETLSTPSQKVQMKIIVT